MAKGIVITKPNKSDYSQVQAYRVIMLLDAVGKLVERTAAHLLADYLERGAHLHEGQYGCRKRRATVDVVAILMNHTKQTWKRKRVAGALLMDVKAPINNVSRQLLIRRMEKLGVEEDLIQ
jgi:hypothetical protein